MIFTPANAALRVSDNNFADIDPSYSSQFSAFSKNKIFSSVGSNVNEFKFRVPGTEKSAYVNSFGLVFTDVDNADATTVEIYEGDRLIGQFKHRLTIRNSPLLACIPVQRSRGLKLLPEIRL